MKSAPLFTTKLHRLAICARQLNEALKRDPLNIRTSRSCLLLTQSGHCRFDGHPQLSTIKSRSLPRKIAFF